jgi:hypothetical protein
MEARATTLLSVVLRMMSCQEGKGRTGLKGARAMTNCLAKLVRTASLGALAMMSSQVALMSMLWMVDQV